VLPHIQSRTIEVLAFKYFDYISKDKTIKN